MNYGPAGAAGWLLKTVGRKPVRVVLALVLEPLFRKGLNKAFGRYVRRAMKRLQNELTSLVNRGMDRHLRLAVTGLSRSGKTAFITAFVNQLLHVHSGARMPLFSPVREERLLGVKRIPQRDLGIQRFTYDEGLAQLYGTPPAWPTPTRGVSEIRLALRYRSTIRCCGTSKTPPRCTWRSSIIRANGCWIADARTGLPGLVAPDDRAAAGERAEWA